MSRGSGIDALVAGVRAGEGRAVARAISLVEDSHPDAGRLLAGLFPHAGKSLVIGVTGPPGAGKSSLVDRMTARLRAGGQTVGIVAVDPTSPFSGGAILGDRIRMQSHATDSGVFIRSMATRGHLGGLAAATDQVLTILDAAGKDVILVETVGVGQDEVEIVGTADVSLVVLVPGLGDEVQALKAGIMEIADVFVVNKADRDGADALVAEIEAMLSLAAGDAPAPPIVRTVATADQGIVELLETVGRLAPGWRPRAPSPRSGGATCGASSRPRCASGSWGGSPPPWLPGRSRAWWTASRSERWTPTPPPTRSWPGRGSPTCGRRIDHLGVAVPSLDEAVAEWEALGFAVEDTHDVPSEQVRVAFLPLGTARVELLEPTAPDSVIARFLEKRSGLHHVCVVVEDLEAALAEMKARGVAIVDDAPRVGAGGCSRRVRAPALGERGAAGAQGGPRDGGERDDGRD